MKFSLAISVLVASTLSAMAADLPVKTYTKEPLADSTLAYNWAGFYVGVNGGGSWGRSNPNVVFAPASGGTMATVDSAAQSINGALGGLQAGYNLQRDRMVFGVETDIQGTSQRGDVLSTITLTTPVGCLGPCPVPPPPPIVTKAPLDFAQKLPWFGTFRGRVGVTPTDSWLIYATGGLAYGEVKTDSTLTIAPGGGCLGLCAPTPGGSVVSNFNQTRLGWTIGAGVEATLGGGWTGKLEYLHIDFGNVSNTFAPIAAIPFVGNLSASGRVTDEIVRVGVNYRFGNAVVAKY